MKSTVNKIFHQLDAIGEKNGIWAITKEIKIGKKKGKRSHASQMNNRMNNLKNY
jgi:hypothetical protein